MSYRVDKMTRIICNRLNDYGYDFSENRMYPKLYQTYLSVRKIISLRLGYTGGRLDMLDMSDNELFDAVQKELDIILPATQK